MAQPTITTYYFRSAHPLLTETVVSQWSGQLIYDRPRAVTQPEDMFAGYLYDVHDALTRKLDAILRADAFTAHDQAQLRFMLAEFIRIKHTLIAGDDISI